MRTGEHVLVTEGTGCAGAILSAELVQWGHLVTKVRGQVFNLGSERGNFIKDEIVLFLSNILSEGNR